MRNHGLSQKDVNDKLTRIIKKDTNFNSGKIFGSMCTTPHSFSQKIYSKYLEKNIGDPGLILGTQKLENDSIRMIGSLLSYPDAIGNVVSGGTEANIIALWTARNYSNTSNAEVILPSHSHHSFDKAADILGLKLIKIPSKNGIMDVNHIEKKITRNTILMIGVAGNTPLGLIDPIDELSDLAIKFSIPLHVDASFGGFIIPFLRKSEYKIPEFDFSLPGVYSIVVDPHKMGMAPIPSSCILFRNSKFLNSISSNVDYLSGGQKPRKTLLGTSPGASIISLWALMNFLGKDGYSKIALRCMKNTQYLYEKLNTISGINIIQKPVLNIIGFKFRKIPNQLLAKKIRKQGWAISVFPTHIRLVIMPHINRQHIDNFIDSLSR
tara:strand:- start:289 stop:1428 length:1140 start_codon:yes stop_codon:yes gene_type:complete